MAGYEKAANTGGLKGELFRVVEGVLFEPDDLHAEPVVYLPEPVL